MSRAAPISLTLTLCLTALASAQAPAAPPPADAGAAGAPAAGQADPYLLALRTGVAQLVARDLDAAVTTLRKAAQQAPQRPEAYCLLGEAQRVKGDRTEALAAYRSCARFAAVAEDATLKLRGLIGEALVTELDLAKRRSEARDSWQRVLDSAQGDAARGLAKARIAAIDAAVELDKRYAEVRERIAAREKAKK